MKPARIVLLALAAVLALLPSTRGQEKQGSQKDQGATPIPAPVLDVETKKEHEAATGSEGSPQVPLKIQVVISEFDGTKKVSSLPYTLYTMGVQPGEGHHPGQLRYNIRVPIGSPTNYNSQNVGTNVDCTAYVQDTTAYRLEFRVNRTWVSLLEPTEKEAMVRGITTAEPGNAPVLPPPVPSFDDDFAVVLKNGQTVEGASAVDPVTGHVLKIEVTLTVLK